MDSVHFDGDVLFAGLRKTRMFRKGFNQGQVDGINANTQAWCKSYFALVSLRDLAYLFATDFHETARTMQPIEEYGKGRGRPYGKRVGRYLKAYYGRGKVQLTWLRNYIFAGKKLGLDLEQFPEKTLEMAPAVRILFQGCAEGWFTGKKLTDYQSYFSKRRVVNGTDKAQLIATYAEEFYEALAAAKREGPDPSPDAPPTPEKDNPIMTFMTKLLGVGKKLLGAVTGKAGSTSILTAIASILGIESLGGDVPGISANIMNGDFMAWLSGILGTAIASKKVADAKAEVDAEEDAEVTASSPLSVTEIQSAIKDALSGKGAEDDADEFALNFADLVGGEGKPDGESWLKGFNAGVIIERHGPDSLKVPPASEPGTVK